ncbi:MAG: alpha/beta hydrolase [Pseudomonadota bacterium]
MHPSTTPASPAPVKATLLATFAAGLAAALIAVPLLAQERGGRPSRECIREIVSLCGRDRAQIPACIAEKASQLSDGCRSEVEQRMEARAGQAGRRGTPSGTPSGEAMQPTAKVSRTIFYGQDRRQQIDVYVPGDAVDDLPLVLFVHGGGWQRGSHKQVQAKPAHFNKANYVFASTGYRVLPEAPVEQQAQDVGAAVQALRAQAVSIGLDPDRIVLMGHSAGAHLAALVATDPQYAGDAFGSIKGVVLLDGAGYDIAARMAMIGPQQAGTYERAFSTDPARQKQLSPLTHVSQGDAPHWLALYVDTRPVAEMQAQDLSAALVSAGSEAKAVAIADTDHGRMNRELGTKAGAAQTEAVDQFLARIFS